MPEDREDEKYFLRSHVPSETGIGIFGPRP